MKPSAVVTGPYGVMLGCSLPSRVGFITRREITLRLIHQGAHGRLQQRRLEVTTGPIAETREETRQQSDGAVETGHDVGDRRAHLRGRSVGTPPSRP